MIIGLRVVIGGRVQGVGFRPFVYRLARRHQLSGTVCNLGGEVEIEVGGECSRVEAWLDQLISSPPPLARPRLLQRQSIEPPSGHFTILPSRNEGGSIQLPPDLFCCDECLKELNDPGQRRYRYPFINCTQCGPRYTLIRDLPYDRPTTTMAGFDLCPDCAHEYLDPGDRRYHAQPLACPRCGPTLTLSINDLPDAEGEAALIGAIAALRSGSIVAVKGVGGYHLLCDATSEESICRLRQLKPRPHKPLAILFPAGPAADPGARLREWLSPTPLEERSVCSPERPIVLIRKGKGERLLAPSMAPGIGEIGAMLPYAPLHHLLANGFDGPLVATSGNRGGEPVLTDPEMATRRLTGVADAFLHHNRPIERPADDPLYRQIDGHCRPLRIGRGDAPAELQLPSPLTLPTLACGAGFKNTIALATDHRALLSPHIGDLDQLATQRLFATVAADLQRIYRIRAERLVVDAHPRFGYQQWATDQGVAIERVYHHHAHASALAGEQPQLDPWLTFTWDGVGLGSDGALWGGELLAGAPGCWQRVASLLNIDLVGGDRVAREPWRTAAALCWQGGHPLPAHLSDHIGASALSLLQLGWQRQLNTHPSSAIGRLFDGVAALLGVVTEASFEGQGPMWLEQMARAADGPAVATEPVEWVDDQGLPRIDWRPWLAILLDQRIEPACRAEWFHRQLAAALVATALRAAPAVGRVVVGLSGGVFQNRLLSELAATGLRSKGFEVVMPLTVPVNDAGVAYGQLVEVAARDASPCQRH